MKPFVSKLAVFSVAALISVPAISADHPKPKLTQAEKEMWQLYCSRNGNGPQKADDLDIPSPNYKNPLVTQAAEKLGQVADKSFYLYGAMKKAYQLSTAKAPSGVSQMAHGFLTYLCGEFRDRPSMVKAKLEWTTKLNKLSVREQNLVTPKGFNVGPGQNVWLQMTASSYRPYLDVSRQIFAAKAAEKAKFNFGKHLDVDGPVDGFTVCETKYVFAKYIPSGQATIPFDYATYKKDYPKFAQANCNQSEIEDYYDFRGDSNYKPNSPEANGMIWYAQSIGNYCETMWKASDQPVASDKKGIKVTDDDCRTYYANPFASRWQAAKAGLSTWLFRHRKYDESVFSVENASVTILPRKLNPIAQPVAEPFAYRIDVDGTPKDLQEFLPEWQALNASVKGSGSMGFNEVMQLGQAASPNVEFAYERLRDAVNRHTDWYSSGWDDQRGMARSQAYSPFVASSYEMSASDSFTAPGITVPGEGDGRKHWMFVFRIKGPKRDAQGKIIDWSQSNWYNTASLKAGVPVDFSRMWIDETSFGTNGLAKHEKAWDRLGTALEGEFDSILYLHNIETSGSISHDGLPGGQ